MLHHPQNARTLSPPEMGTRKRRKDPGSSLRTKHPVSSIFTFHSPRYEAQDHELVRSLDPIQSHLFITKAQRS